MLITTVLPTRKRGTYRRPSTRWVKLGLPHPTNWRGTVEYTPLAARTMTKAYRIVARKRTRREEFIKRLNWVQRWTTGENRKFYEASRELEQWSVAGWQRRISQRTESRLVEKIYRKVGGKRAYYNWAEGSGLVED